VPVYTEPLLRAGMACETVGDELQSRLDQDVFALGEGRAGSGAVAEAVALLRSRQVDGIILGCTEFPLLLGDEADDPDLVNPAALLAEAAVSHALR
jgi:aspartate/glutamate racemase